MKSLVNYILRPVLPLALLLSLSSLSGCAAFAYLVATLAPPPEVKKQFDLPRDKRVLVFTDDQVSPISYPPFKKMLATKLCEQFKEHKLASDTIGYDRIIELQSTNPNFDRMPIDEVGRKLGADLVIYIQMGEFRLKDAPNDPLWHGRTMINVRVVDVKQRKRLWPEMPQEGFSMSAETEVVENSDAGYSLRITEQMATTLADQTAKLFYTYRQERK